MTKPRDADVILKDMMKARDTVAACRKKCEAAKAAMAASDEELDANVKQWSDLFSELQRAVQP